jgi:hypothetical protein
MTTGLGALALGLVGALGEVVEVDCHFSALGFPRVC